LTSFERFLCERENLVFDSLIYLELQRRSFRYSDGVTRPTVELRSRRLPVVVKSSIAAEVLNTNKTEFIWCCPSRRRRHIPDGDFHVNADQVKPDSAVRNLGVFLDGEMSMRSHISHVAASCFTEMPQIRFIYEDRYHPLRGRCSLPVLFTLSVGLF